MNSAVIDIDHLVCHAGGRVTLDIRRLSVKADERVAVIGPNGAGKSTLLRVLSGFTPVHQGQVSVLGHNLAPHPDPRKMRALRREVAQVMQGLHLVQRLTARENVLIGALGRWRGWRSCLRWPGPAQLAAAQDALAAVGMHEREFVRADHLSGGERQKIAIARMLMQQPRLILADEPTASLDPAAAQAVCRLLARSSAGATLICVVHNPALLPAIADRVLGLRQGRLSFDLPIDQVDEQALDQLYTPTPDAALASMARAAAGPRARETKVCPT